jgi:prepilin-type processing-associated H-X9-DG protein
MYADDNKDGLPYVIGSANGRPDWCTGDLNNAAGRDRTNITMSVIYPYVKDAKLWTCPSDQSRRIRSISMSQVFGLGAWNPAYRNYAKLTEIVKPSNTWVTIDENPRSVNDAGFAVVCANATSPTQCYLVDYPSPLHGGGAGLSFADGHSEIHKFKSSVITKASTVVNGGYLPQVTGTVANNLVVDISWLAENTTVPR